MRLSRFFIDAPLSLGQHELPEAQAHYIGRVLRHAMGDAVQLSQVLFNVVRNAMESVEKVQARSIRLDIRQENREILIEVHDTGLGLSESAAEQAGDPFYTTKISGLGMGLSISKTILAQFHGRLSLHNTENGACTLIALPVAEVT